MIYHQTCNLLTCYLLRRSASFQRLIPRASLANTMSTKEDLKAFADKDGHFRRQPSKFRDWISRESGAKFPAEKDRYVRLSLDVWVFERKDELQICHDHNRVKN